MTGVMVEAVVNPAVNAAVRLLLGSLPETVEGMRHVWQSARLRQVAVTGMSFVPNASWSARAALAPMVAMLPA